jgi:hypothetical protein
MRTKTQNSSSYMGLPRPYSVEECAMLQRSDQTKSRNASGMRNERGRSSQCEHSSNMCRAVRDTVHGVQTRIEQPCNKLAMFWRASAIGKHLNSTSAGSLRSRRSHSSYFRCPPSDFISLDIETKQAPWPESTSELYRPSDRRCSAKLVPTFADRWVLRSQCGGSLGFLDCSRYFFFQVAPQLYSRG